MSSPKSDTAALKTEALKAADALKAVIATQRKDAQAWTDLGILLPNGVSADVQGDFRSSRECFFEALALCRKYAKSAAGGSKKSAGDALSTSASTSTATFAAEASSSAASFSGASSSLYLPVAPHVEAEAWLGLGASLTKTMHAEFPNRTLKTQKQCFEAAVNNAIAAEARAEEEGDRYFAAPAGGIASSSSASSSSSPTAARNLGDLFSLQMKAWLHLGASLTLDERAAVGGKEVTGPECLTRASLLKAKLESWAAQKEAVDAHRAARGGAKSASYAPAETVITVAERVALELQKQQKLHAEKKQREEEERQARRAQRAAAAAAQKATTTSSSSSKKVTPSSSNAAAAAPAAAGHDLFTSPLQPRGDDDDDDGADEGPVEIDMEKLTRVSAATASPLQPDDNGNDKNYEDDDDNGSTAPNSTRQSAASNTRGSAVGVARSVAAAVAAAIAEEERQREIDEEERAAKQCKYPVSFWLCLADAIAVSSVNSSAKEMAISALESLDDEEFLAELQHNPSANLRLLCYEKAVEAAPRDHKLWLALEEALASEIERQVNIEVENTTSLSLENLNALQMQQQTTSITGSNAAAGASNTPRNKDVAPGARGAAAAAASAAGQNEEEGGGDDDEEDDAEGDDDEHNHFAGFNDAASTTTSFVASTSGITTASDLNANNANKGGNNQHRRIDKTVCHVFGDAYTRKRCVLKAIECAPADPAAWLRLSALLPMNDPAPAVGVAIGGQMQQPQQQTLLDGVTVVTRRNCLERAILLSPDHPADAWIALAELLMSGGGGGSYKFTLPQDVVRAHNTPSGGGAAPPRVPLKNTYTAMQCLERALELDAGNVRGWIALSNYLSTAQLLQTAPGSHYDAPQRVSQHVTAKIGNERNITAQNCVERALALNFDLAWGWQRLALMLAANQQELQQNSDPAIARANNKLSKRAMQLSSSVLLGEFVSTRSKRRLLRLTNQVLQGIRRSMPAVLHKTLRGSGATATVRGKPLTFEQVLVRCVETNECAETWSALGQYLAGTGGTVHVAGYYVFDEHLRTDDTKPREVDTAFCWQRVVEHDRLSMEGWSYLGATMAGDFVEVGGETFSREEVFEQAHLCDLRTADGLIQMGLEVGGGVVLCGAEEYLVEQQQLLAATASAAAAKDSSSTSQHHHQHHRRVLIQEGGVVVTDSTEWERRLVGDILAPGGPAFTVETDAERAHREGEVAAQAKARAALLTTPASTSPRAAAPSVSPRHADTTFLPAERSHLSHRQLAEKAAATSASAAVASSIFATTSTAANLAAAVVASASATTQDKKRREADKEKRKFRQRQRSNKEVIEEQVQYFLRAAAMDPLDYRAYAYLGTALPPGRRVMIGSDEETFNNIDALLRAIRIQPDNGRLWLHLGRILAFDDLAYVEGAAAAVAAPFVTTEHEFPPRNFIPPQKSSNGSNSGGAATAGKKSGVKTTALYLDRLQVFQVAANLNGGDAETWMYLAQQLYPEDINERMTAVQRQQREERQRRKQEAKRADKSNSGDDDDEEEEEEDDEPAGDDSPLAPLPTTVVVDGHVYTKRQCFECAAHLDATLALSWTHLFCCLPETEGASASAVVAGRQFSREECFYEGLQLE